VVKATIADIPSDLAVPAWESLPFEVLVSIFQYASWPLLDENRRVTPGPRWLCDASRTCRAFAEPALSVLYEDPPLGNPPAATQLLDVLKSQSEDASRFLFNYRAKIKHINLDVSTLSMRGRGQFNFPQMVPLLSKLTEVTLQHAVYRPPFRLEGPPARNWHYTSQLFDTFASSHLRLTSWVWSANMLSDVVPGVFAPHMPVHEDPWCAALKHLTFAGFEFEGLAALSTSHLSNRAIKSKAIKARFADVLKPLHQLSSLEFISCHSSSWTILSHLPRNLTSLTIANSNIISSTIEDFLQTHGRSLESLVLHYNDHLSLNFLPVLGAACPSLKTFLVDLTYYNRLVVQSVSGEPVYETLLDDGLIPSWPKSMQRLSLLQLRKWSTAAALNFLNSLIDSAGDLPDLRHLELHAMLPEASWRERARLREEWTEKLNTVFLRKSAPPNAHLASHKAYRMWKAKQDEEDEMPLAMATGRENEEDEMLVAVATGRASRRRKRTEEARGSQKQQGVHFIHGMCNVVNVTIDNLRPSENQFTEGDFLDSEVEGDDDWNEEVGDPAEDTRRVFVNRRRWRSSRY
jgi:hypothetical protein